MDDDAVVGFLDPSERVERFQDYDDNEPEMMPVYASDLDKTTRDLIQKGRWYDSMKQTADEQLDKRAQYRAQIQSLKRERDELKEAADALAEAVENESGVLHPHVRAVLHRYRELS